MGTSSALLSVQSIPYWPTAMIASFIMISQAIWYEIMMRLAMLEAKVQNMEGGVKASVKIKLEN